MLTTIAILFLFVLVIALADQIKEAKEDQKELSNLYWEHEKLKRQVLMFAHLTHKRLGNHRSRIDLQQTAIEHITKKLFEGYDRLDRKTDQMIASGLGRVK